MLTTKTPPDEELPGYTTENFPNRIHTKTTENYQVPSSSKGFVQSSTTTGFLLKAWARKTPERVSKEPRSCSEVGTLSIKR